MKVPLPNAPFLDDRGSITNLTTTGTQSVAVIASKAGSVRAKHKHPDEHAAFVVSGRVEYHERWPNGERTHAVNVYGPGDFFYTRGGVDHAMKFLEDTVLVTIASGVRDHENHERALVRTEWPEL